MTGRPDRGRLGAAFWGWLLTASLTRAPTVMSAVAATTLTGLALGEPDRGGVLAAASVVGLLLGTPVALLAQRHVRPRPLLVLQLTAVASTWALLALAVRLGWSTTSWLGLALLAGVAMAGSAGLVRSLMGAVVPVPARGRASTVDALSQDAVTFLAPVVVSVGALVAGAPGAPLAVGVVALLAAARATRLAEGPAPGQVEAPPPPPADTPAGPRKRLVWSAVSLALGLTLGAAEAGAVGLAVRLGLGVGSVYVLFLVLAGASLLGAWLDTAVLAPRLGPGRSPVLLATMAAGSLLVALGPSWPTVVLGLGLIGLPTAAVLGLRSNVFDGDPPQEARRGLTVSFAAQSAGFAAGAALLAAVGQPATLVLGAALLGLVSVVTRRRR